MLFFRLNSGTCTTMLSSNRDLIQKYKFILYYYLHNNYTGIHSKIRWGNEMGIKFSKIVGGFTSPQTRRGFNCQKLHENSKITQTPKITIYTPVIFFNAVVVWTKKQILRCLKNLCNFCVGNKKRRTLAPTYRLWKRWLFCVCVCEITRENTVPPLKIYLK